jgi:SPP1 gp7 family putative phage head morphogenesis protein
MRYIKLSPVHANKRLDNRYNAQLKSIIKSIKQDIYKQVIKQNPSSIKQINSIIEETLDSYKDNDNIVILFISSIVLYTDRLLVNDIRKRLKVDVTKLLTNNIMSGFIKQSIKDNVNLIKSVKLEFKNKLEQEIFDDLSNTNFNSFKLKRYLKKTLSSRSKFKSINTRIDLIARDQTSKTTAKSLEIRHRQLGVYSYQWLGIEDARERPSHVANNNKIFSYNNPPVSTGNPGQDIRCRCTALGIIPVELVNTFKNI